MTKNIYEIFDEFAKAKTEKDRRQVLINNQSHQLITFLQLAFDPRIKFTVKEIPKYKPMGAPAGMGYANMGNALKKTYLFVEGHPRRPRLTDKKQDQLLIQILESLEDREAVAYIQMLKKQVSIPFLTPKLIEKTFLHIFEIPVKV